MSDTDCSKVVTIPQYTGTCWFNALLMCIFYSEGMRSVLLKKASEWPQKNTRAIFHEILTQQYNAPQGAQSFFDKIKPEVLLAKLHKENARTFEFNPEKNSGYKGIWYIRKLLEYLGVQVTILDAVQSKPNGFGFGFGRINEGMKYTLYDSKINYISEIIPHGEDMFDVKYSNIKKDQPPAPEVLVIHVPSPSTHETDNNYLQSDFLFKSEITVNNISYVADAMLLANYNIQTCNAAHEIAGVTCGGERYMYNGWTLQTKDAAMGNTTVGYSKPCPLMKYDWLKQDINDYCINREKCGLKILNEAKYDDVCFKFQHGQRTYVYVRKQSGGRALQKICYKHKMDNIQAYLKGVYEAYYLNDPYLRNMNPSNFSQELQKFIFEFAHAQDSVYDEKLQTYKELNPSHTDDIFEIYFLSKYGNGKKQGVTDLELIHDAWTLSRLVMFDPTMTKLVPHVESGQGELQKATGENAVDIKDNDKQLINLAFATGVKIDGIGNPLTPHTIVQRRRLKQFVKYDDLPKHEQVKDQPAIDLFYSMKKQYNYQNDDITSFLSGGRKKAKAATPRPTAERVQIGSRQQVVYVGPRGGKYIKQKGAFIRLPKVSAA